MEQVWHDFDHLRGHGDFIFRFRDIFDDYVDKMKEAVEAEEAEK